MSTRISPDRLLRSLTILVLPFALLAALLPATSQPASAGESTLIRSNFQVYLCPTDYDGSDYLIDCDNGGAGEFSITAQDTDPVNPIATDSTDEGGFIELGTVPGSATFSLEVPGDFARFYLACFDADGVFQFDGTTNVFDVTLAEGDALNCRWYVIPEDAGAPSPAPSQPEAAPAIESIDVQVFVCPVAYAGDAYLTDCDPTEDPVGVLLSPAFPFDSDDFVTAQTATDGRVGFDGLAADDYSVAVDVPGDFADFYHACFDVSSGSEVFLFSGFTNTADFPFADQTFTAVSCRFYVIPVDARGETPSASPSVSPSAVASVRPTATPRASASPGGINVLPSTGTGPDSNDAIGSLALVVIAAVAVAGVAAVARRAVVAR